MGDVIPLFDGRKSRRRHAGPPAATSTAPKPPPSWLAPEPEPEPWDPERSHRGAALCRALLPTGASTVLDPDDPRRDAALRRARTERRRPTL